MLVSRLSVIRAFVTLMTVESVVACDPSNGRAHRVADGDVPFRPVALAMLNREGPQFRQRVPRPSVPTLMVLFSESDCRQGLADIPFWHRLHEEFREYIDVVGIAVGPNRGRLGYFVTGLGIQIPVLHDDESTAASQVENMGFPLVPRFVLLGRDGRLEGTWSAANGNQSRQQEILEDIRLRLRLL